VFCSPLWRKQRGVTAFETVAFDFAQSVWVYPIVMLLSAADAFTIVLPSETVVAGLASTALSLGAPNLVGLGLVAALGAHLGDLGVFFVGRVLARTRWVRDGSRIDRALRWTRARLDTQGPLYIMSARYIPYGRILVNAAAGSSGYPVWRFVALSAVGCVVWAGAYVGIGAGAGSWFGDQWWVALIVAVVLAIILGFIVDRLIRRSRRRS
jgi:membrane protein DedA with SNARE-associated domain